jgi:hypothetical protein
MVPRERLFSKESIFDVVVGLPATCLVQVRGELGNLFERSMFPTTDVFLHPLSPVAYAVMSHYITHDFLCLLGSVLCSC